MEQALGPLVAGFAVQKKGWRWSSWELLWISAPIAILMLFALPETSSDTILLKRAQRLRQATQCNHLVPESGIRQHQMNVREVAVFALIKPWEINALDPAVLFSTVYTALTYGIYYSFFESFPLVFMDIYGFNLGELGIAFLAVLVGLVVAVVLLCAYLYFIAPKRLAKLHPVPPETRIWPGLLATFLIPVGLIIFGKLLRNTHTPSANLRSLDSKSLHPLGRTAFRGRNKHVWRVHHRPVHVHLSPFHVSSVLRIALCRQRLCSRSLRRRSSLVLPADVSKVGNQRWSEPTGWLCFSLQFRNVRDLLFRSKFKKQKSICGFLS